MNSIIIIAGSLVAFAAIVAIMLYSSSGKGKRKAAGNKEMPSTGKEGGQDFGYAAQPVSGTSVSTEKHESVVPVVDCRGRSVPSPERPVTDTDAVIVDLIRQAPELPSAVLELSRALRDPDAQIKSVVDLVNTDPVLSAKILRVTNSAAFGVQKITSLQQAIVLLGFQNIWILVHQLMTSQVLQPFARIDRDEMEGLWRHAAAVAVCARRILLSAGYATHEVGATVITCALMHDVGKFLLRGLQPIRRERDDLPGRDEKILPTVLDEEERYGINHCRLGYLLSTYWKLPEQVCTSIGYHHHASFDNWTDIPRHVLQIVAMVALSDSVASASGYHDGRPVTQAVLPEVIKAAGLSLEVDPEYFLTTELEKDLKHMEALTRSTAEQAEDA